MAKARAIVKRRKAVVNIRKITRTMEMIATARFKKAHDRAVQARAYADKIAEMVRDIATAGGEARHPLLESRETISTARLVVLTSNRGLCGGYNSGVLRVATHQVQTLTGAGAATQIYACGKRGIGYFRFRKMRTAGEDTRFEDRPAYSEVEEIADAAIDDFVMRRIDALVVVYTKFLSSSRQAPVAETLLPVAGTEMTVAEDETAPGVAAEVPYEFEPDPHTILSALAPASFKVRLFSCFLDAAVSEQVARMVAMHGATENAETMIKNLTRAYNRARQTQITNEIAELMGGAEALEG